LRVLLLRGVPEWKCPARMRMHLDLIIAMLMAIMAIAKDRASGGLA